MADVKENIQDLKKRLQDDATEIKQTVANLNDAIDMKRDIRLEKLSAKIDHAEDVIAMKHTVKKESKEFKKKKES